MNNHPKTKWRFYIDRGGSFTDVIARSPDGTLLSTKLLSENPENYDDAALEAIRRFLKTPKSQPLPTDMIESVKIGTTVATNALLERKGAPVALVMTKGLRDALDIAYQARADIFALNIQKPAPFYERVIEAHERMDANGNILVPLDIPTVQAHLRKVYDEGFRSLAICLLHAYLNPEHEDKIATIAKQIGFTHVMTSAQASPLVKLIPRGQTAVLDAYLSPVLRAYVQKISTALTAPDGENSPDISFMQSSGGLANLSHFYGRNAVLS
ncbi:MAG TPA: 5-oxoprolinase, partial [Hellea balneolensis]|nr:5-oxoprolinase [Hellea balneolensis]